MKATVKFALFSSLFVWAAVPADLAAQDRFEWSGRITRGNVIEVNSQCQHLIQNVLRGFHMRHTSLGRRFRKCRARKPIGYSARH